MVMLSALIIFGLIAQGAYGKPPSKITNGEDAARGEFPYQISLRIYDVHACGGAIISDRHVLTAAHCFENLEEPYSEMTVVAGTNSLKPGSGGKGYVIQSVARHPKYVRQTQRQAGKFDIAVIKTKKQIVENEFQKRIPLATENPPFNVWATVTGFGRTSETSGSSTILQKGQVKLISGGDCFSNGVRIQPSQICGFTPGISTCKGDSGGPLVYNNQVVGVVASSGPCGANYPEVYTKVYSTLDFITKAMKEL